MSDTSILKGKKVLVVDDEEDIRELFVMEFESHECEVSQASGGNESLKLIDDNDFDIVISDIRMPEGTGIDLLENFPKNKLNSSIIVMVSGFSDLTQERALELGALDIFDKPFILEDVVSHIVKKLKSKS